MKKIFNFNKYVLMLLAFVLVSMANQHTLSAQSCDQVEILYKQPDCFKPKGSDGTANPQAKPCTPITVCVNQPYTYTAAGTWASYLWTVTSGPATPIINPNATSPNAIITWPLVGTYILTLTVTDGLGNTYTKCLEVTVREKPVANFTFSPNNACAGSIINFTNTTTFSGVASYSWNFGDPASGGNNTSILTNPTHIYNTPGTYTVTLIAYSTVLVPNNGSQGQHGDSLSAVTCCADTIKKTVTVIPGTVKIECISTVCAGDTATYTAVGCASPTWFAPTGGSILSQSGNQITIVWGNGNPQGQLSVLCAGGCTAYVTVPILPSSPVIVGNTSPCNTSNTSYSLPYLPGTYYTWTLTNVTTATNANNLLSTYPDNNTVWINWANAAPGNTYQLSIFLDNKHLCCNSTGNLTIIPKQKFSVLGPASICVGQSGSFSTNPSGTFDWSIAPTLGVSPSSATGTANYTPTFSNTGTYVVTALNTSSAFCNTTATASVVVVPVPTNGTIQGPDTACANGQYNYSMTPAAPTGYYYEWTITNGSFQPGNITPTTSGNSVSVLWNSMPGTLSVVLRQSAAPFCVTPATTKTVVAATVGSVSGTLNVCVDGTGNYTLTGGNLPAGEVITWTITPSSHGTITAGQGTNNITVLWHGQGGSGPWGPVTISASTGCGPATPMGGIMIYQKFSLSIATAGIDVCQPAGLTLTANGAPGGSSYLWSPGGAATQSMNATSAGTYTILAIMGGCSATKSIQILDPFLLAPVTCGVGECKGLNTNELLGVIVKKPVSGTFTYQWFSGTYPTGTSVQGPTTTAALSDNYLATDSGNYYVVVNYGICTKYEPFYVKKVCCPDKNKPKITTVTQVTCNTYSFIGFTPNPGGDSITWDFGDGTTAPGASNVAITHTYANAGIYCVKFCVGSPSPNPTNCAGNCTATSVIVPIQASILATLGCNGCVNVANNSVVIISPPASVSYFWNFGDGFTSTLQSPPAHCYSSGGTYTVSLTITYNNNAVPSLTCTSVATQTVTYTPLSISSTAPVCTGVPVLFSSTPGGFQTYSWNFGDGATAYISPISHSYINAANNIPVTLSVTDLLGNTCTDSININVLQGINGCTILPGYICPGGSAMLSTTLVLGYTYLWEQETSPNVYAPAPGTNNGNSYTTVTTGNYRVIVTNANGCVCTSNTVAVTAVAAPKATFTISPSRNLCSPGGMATLTAAAVSGYTYDWYANGNYGSPVGSGAMFMTFVSTTTTYNLVVTNQYGCTDTCSMTVTVNATPAPPNIISNPGGTLCEGSPIQLGVNNYTGNITWSTGANTLSISVTAAGTYLATYTDPATGCSSTSSIVVNRKPSAGLFPHHCDSIPCHCSRPFVIYAPNPLIGIFASNYNIDWYNANTNTYLASGATYNNGGVGVQTGSYYVVITDQTTGCKDTSEQYSVLVPPCDTCNCYESFWDEIVLTTPVIKKIVACKSSDTIKCNTAYTINTGYNCSDTACAPKVTYSMLLPDNTVQTGNVAFTFTPTLPGTYTVTLYGWCGNKICDSCVIKLVSTCIKCDCKGSKWVEKLYTINNVTQIIKCMKPADKAIDVTCKIPISINAMYNCVGTGCNSAATYTLVQPSGTTTGTVPLTFTPSVSGNYTVTLYGWCGNVICDTCVIKFKTFCPADTACCPYDIKLDTGKVKYDYVQIPNATVISETFTINGLSTANITEVRANVLSYTITDNYGKECMKCVNLPFTWASIASATTLGGATPAITMYGGTTVPSFNGSGAGVYQNPREVIWNNGAFINIPNNTNVGINFIVPPKPAINCCELRGRICVKFTFRDKDCKECTAIGCFQFVIK